MTRIVAALATFFMISVPARADHHLVKRALQEARCLPASVREISKAGTNVVYEARCRGAANRVLILVCSTVRCVVDEHGSHAPGQEEDEP